MSRQLCTSTAHGDAKRRVAWLLAGFTALMSLGCSAFPEVRHRPRLHNPFPQIKQVAVLPFFNQSEEPTLDGDAVALAYYAELQSIPGFEVLPLGVSRNLWLQYSRAYGEPRSGEEFQQLARFMGVEAVVVGAVTDFDAYYPPRLAMTVHWYAANPAFHPVPPGYGLPWGTKKEKRIPRHVVEQAEFELAREQLATQTPLPSNPLSAQPTSTGEVSAAGADVAQAQHEIETMPPDEVADSNSVGSGVVPLAVLPQAWPDPTGFIPDSPSPTPPVAMLQFKPILTHTNLYRGNDESVTNRLANYVGNSDEARTSGWQGYLNRSNDFIRFCCHLHLAEMLESRGGLDQSDLILRWPISRY